jgi:hypothetical protein
VFHGPDLNSYDVDSAVGFASLVWSECGANWPLNIEASVTVASNNPSEHAGFIENDSADGSIKFIAGIQWRGC